MRAFSLVGDLRFWRLQHCSFFLNRNRVAGCIVVPFTPGDSGTLTTIEDEMAVGAVTREPLRERLGQPDAMYELGRYGSLLTPTSSGAFLATIAHTAWLRRTRKPVRGPSPAPANDATFISALRRSAGCFDRQTPIQYVADAAGSRSHTEHVSFMVIF